jgi:hypothetical protein
MIQKYDDLKRWNANFDKFDIFNLLKKNTHIPFIK